MKRVVLLITMLTVAATSSWAQNGEIVYHKDITPKEMRTDDPWPGNIRQFDFDEDSTLDFFIAWAEYREWHIIAYTYGNWWFERQILEPGDTIATVPSWFPEPENPDYGPEISFDSGFSKDSIIIGFKNQVGDGEFCYGWIRFSLDAGPERLPESGNRVPWAHGVCTFLDYAYCTQPNYPLRAGQTSYSASVNENAPDAFVTVLPNPTQGIVTIIGENLRQVVVVNLLGQQMLSVQGKGDELGLDMAALPAGVYFVTVTNEEGRKCVCKVVKE
jgi:hypothetical protein